MRVGILVRVDADEREMWKAAAEERRVSVNEMVRQAVAHHLVGNGDQS
jgi:predicted HicB family RNase H-like nuclease